MARIEEPMEIRQEEWALESRDLSIKFTELVGRYQQTRVLPGRHHVYIIMAALAFSAMIVIRSLPRDERQRLRDFFVDKFDSALKEHGR